MGGYGHNTTGSGTRTAAYLRATTELSKHLGGTRQQARPLEHKLAGPACPDPSSSLILEFPK